MTNANNELLRKIIREATIVLRESYYTFGREIEKIFQQTREKDASIPSVTRDQIEVIPGEKPDEFILRVHGVRKVSYNRENGAVEVFLTADPPPFTYDFQIDRENGTVTIN